MVAFFNCSFKNRNGTLSGILTSSVMNLIYTHDEAGNIISDGGRTFVYNQNSRLVQVTEGSSVIAEYAYDGFGRRVKKTVGSDITHYHYDLNGLLISETDGSGSPVRDYVYLNDEPVAMKVYGSPDAWYYFLNDHLGTPQKVVDSSGAVVWSAGYLPFGEAHLIVADVENNLRFPGQYFDGETGLHNNWHRYFDPEMGRYLTPDPIGLDGGINLYSYCLNDPVNMIDPTGEFGFIIPIFAAIGEAIGIGGGGASLGSFLFGTAAAFTTTDAAIVGTAAAGSVIAANMMAAKGSGGGSTCESKASKRQNISIKHPTRKRAMDAAKKTRQPQPKKGASKKKWVLYREQQKYKKPEHHPDSKHPEWHYHDSNKSSQTVNRYHKFPE